MVFPIALMFLALACAAPVTSPTVSVGSTSSPSPTATTVATPSSLGDYTAGDAGRPMDAKLDYVIEGTMDGQPARLTFSYIWLFSAIGEDVLIEVPGADSSALPGSGGGY